jgi:GH24 family phage-related lysozyme (muramidase)
VRYQDSLGVWTIGDGFNLERADAPQMLRACGANPQAIADGAALTPAQAQMLFVACLSGLEDAARASLAPGIYDALTDARRFVLLDLEYNLGSRGWLGFPTTRALLTEAEQQKVAGKLPIAHALFNLAGDHLQESAWDGQVGDRALRDISMIRSGLWCDATGMGA